VNKKKLFEILVKKINFVIVDEEIKNGKFELMADINVKYSFNKSNKLFLDGNMIKTIGVHVCYNCPTCDVEHKILLKRLLSKKTLRCKLCKEMVESKRKTHSEFIKESYLKNGCVCPSKDKTTNPISLSDLIKVSNNQFNNETDVFKESYYKKRLTKDEFEKIMKKIVYINGIKISSNYKFYEHIKSGNQIKYSQYLINIDNGEKINLSNVSLRCDSCDDVFNTTRFLKEKILYDKIRCRNCNLCNKVFKIRNITNILNEKVNYQSKPEYKLILFCNSNNILIQNGPKLKLKFDGKDRIYIVDFSLPNLKLIVEIKANHVWHKNQVASGLWESKENAAHEFCNNNSFKYELIFQNQLNNFLTALRYSLN